MLPHITSEMLRDSVMLRAGREPHDSWALPAFENWNFWKKAENCKQQQKKWSHLLHIQDGRFRVFPYHFRKLWIKEELWASESDRCMCEIRDDQFSHTFPFSDFISEIPLLYIVSHCLPELLVTFFSSSLIATDCISEIMIIWNCSVEVRENESYEPSDKPWLRSTTETIQNIFWPQIFDFLFREVIKFLFEKLRCFQWVSLYIILRLRIKLEPPHHSPESCHICTCWIWDCCHFEINLFWNSDRYWESDRNSIVRCSCLVY